MPFSSAGLASELKGVIRGEVDASPETREKYARDASLFYVRPEAVVYPKDAEDVERLVRFVSEEKKKGRQLSLTARSAGTDMSGGPLNDSIIVDMTRHFNHIVEIREGHAIVEPGVYYRDFDTATQAAGWELPSYTASRELNTLGGMIANNSGGEKNLKYGKTARYVLELEVVLSDGKRHLLKFLADEELERKCADDSFEGELYRAMRSMLVEHHALIERSAPKVEKNSSGYALWAMGDGRQGLNMARLMVGAQGTLGIITKARLRLVRPQPYSSMVVMFLNDLAELGALVPGVLAFGPDSFESYDDNTFKLAVKYFPEFASQMKAGIFSLGLQFLPELWMLLTGGVPKLVLMAEFRGASQPEALERAERLAKNVRKAYPHVKARVAKSEVEARKYWTMRRESFNLLRKKVRGMRTAPFIDDFVVPPQTLPVFLPKLQEILSRYDLFYTVQGHVGDGNFHIIPLIDPHKPGMDKVIDELSHEVYDLVLSFGGSITGEHNDGLIRTPYVEKMFGTPTYRLFEEVKKLFDPLGIFNPGKKVGGSFLYSSQHLDLPGDRTREGSA